MSEQYKVLLKKHGLRITPIRINILNKFDKSIHALSAKDLENGLDNPDRITLYRTIKSFESKGIIHKAVDGTDVVKYALCDHECDENDHHHHHVQFHCEKCDQTFCVDEIEIPQLRAPTGYKVKNTNIIMDGICESCS